MLQFRDLRCLQACMCDSYVWHDSFICDPWLIHICTITHPYVCHDPLIYAPWLIYTCAMTHSCVCHVACVCLTCWMHTSSSWLVNVEFVTHEMWDIMKYVTLLTRVGTLVLGECTHWVRDSSISTRWVRDSSISTRWVRDSSISSVWLSPSRVHDSTRSHVWHTSFICIN